MKDIGAAIFLPKRILRRVGVENEHPLVPCRVGEREKCGCREIGENKRDAPRNKPVQRGGRIVARPQGDVLDRKGLTEETSGCIIVFNGKLGTGDAIVCGWNIENSRVSLGCVASE